MTADTKRRISIAGASGRMGRMLIEAVRASGDCELVGALDIAASPFIGTDATAFAGTTSGVLITADLQRGLSGADVLIDFTRPEGSLAHLAVCRELGINAVIGTTGFSAGQKAAIDVAAREIAIVMAPNMSVGVNVTLKLLEMRPGRSPPDTTSKSSRRTIATRSTPRRAPRSRWARSSRRRWAATSQTAPSTGATA